MQASDAEASLGRQRSWAEARKMFEVLNRRIDANPCGVISD